MPFSLSTICRMHPSAVRLYEAAKKLKEKTTEAEIAALLGETDQVINNWGRRGVSMGGAIKAQAKIGCDSTWLLEGTGKMVAAWPFALELQGRYNNLEPDQKKFIEASVTVMVQGYESVNKAKPSGESSASSHAHQLENAA